MVHQGSGMLISVIVPVLNEASNVTQLSQHLTELSESAEVIIVDGGSVDGSATLFGNAGLRVVTSPPGRAHQMNTGAQHATGDVLLFLHADTVLPHNATGLVTEAVTSGKEWGRFDVQIVGASRMLPVVSFMMNHRSRITGFATGDQAIFVTTPVFHDVGGFPPQPLMEDIELCRRLLRRSKPACLRARARTSGRRWDTRGAWRTIFLMWHLRFDYWRGVSAEHIARRYR